MTYYFNVGYGVAFPDVRVVDGFGMDRPREIVLDLADVANLLRWVQLFFSRLRPETRTIQQLDSYVLEKIERDF